MEQRNRGVEHIGDIIPRTEAYKPFEKRNMNQDQSPEQIEEAILDLVAASPTSKNLDLAKKLLTTYRKAIDRKARARIPAIKAIAK